jgi:hypothetical protein
MVCGPRRGGNVTIGSLRLVSALTEIGERAAPQGAVREAAGLASPLLYAQEIKPHTGWHLGNFPRPFRTWRSFNACVHLIGEDERIGAGQVTLNRRPVPLGTSGLPPLTSQLSL